MSPIAQPAPSTLRKRPLRDRLPSREELVEKARVRMAVPRVQMTILLAATGGAGFLTSYGLLQAGLDDMALRYPIAVGVGYLVFFLLLRLWLALQGDPGEMAGDALDLAGDALDLVGDVADLGMPAPRSAPALRSSSSFDLDFGLPDLDEGLILVFLAVAAAAAVAVLGAVIYVLYLAPILLAEILVDGVLLVGLYRRLKRSAPEHWAFGAVRRTWIPAAIVAVTFFFAGMIFQSLAPQARSIGGVWKAVTTEERAPD